MSSIRIFIGIAYVYNMIKMDELEITKDLIRVLAFYGILKDWDMYELLDEYEHLGIPIVLVNETLREGVE